MLFAGRERRTYSNKYKVRKLNIKYEEKLKLFKNVKYIRIKKPFILGLFKKKKNK